jgi:hypothetical protein
MWWPFRPKHTLESVAIEIIEGLDNGTVVLPWTEEELDALERQPEALFAPPPIAVGPFKQYPVAPTGSGTLQRKKKRATSETVRVSGVLVDSWTRIAGMSGYASG